MQFELDLSSRLPIYEQLIGQVREAVARGDLQADDRLPTVRQLSQILVINPNTVSRAYAELAREGVLYNRPGRGAFVAQQKSDQSREVRKRRLNEYLDTFLTEAVHLGFSQDDVMRAVATRVSQFQWASSKASTK